MEFQTMTAKLANDRVEKMFGDKDPELKALVQMEMTLDPDDPDDVEKKNKFLAKLTKEHKKDVDELINEKVWNIHDEKGNLVPHLYRDGKFIKYEPNILEEDDRQQSD
jgi:hypothetical protein